MSVNENNGVVIPEEISDFSVSIYDWFFSFLSSVNILYKESYVLINDIESFKIWIEIRRKGNYVYISKTSGEKIGSGDLIRTKELPSVQYPYWKNKKVKWPDFKHEIIQKTKQYLSELTKLNPPNNPKILKLSSLVEELDNSNSLF